MTVSHAAKYAQHPWESAVGKGSIVGVLRHHNRVVVASDIVDHDVPLDFVTGFTTTPTVPAGIGAIVAPQRAGDASKERTKLNSPKVGVAAGRNRQSKWRTCYA